MCEQLPQQQKKEYKGFFNNHDSIFVLLGVRKQLENFLNFNKRSGARGGRNCEKCQKQRITMTQGKFDAYRLLCLNRFTRRKENEKFVFEQKKLSFAFK